MHAPMKYFGLLSLACLIVLVFYAAPARACYCPYRNLQDIYCEADYVALVGVKAYIFRAKKHLSYDINIYQTIKVTPEGNKTLESGKLAIPPVGSKCFVDLSFHKYYLIAGKGTELDACDFIRDTDELTAEEKKTFRGDFIHDCYWS